MQISRTGNILTIWIVIYCNNWNLPSRLFSSEGCLNIIFRNFWRQWRVNFTWFAGLYKCEKYFLSQIVANIKALCQVYSVYLICNTVGTVRQIAHSAGDGGSVQLTVLNSLWIVAHFFVRKFSSFYLCGFNFRCRLLRLNSF
jgi:hypothetical protein